MDQTVDVSANAQRSFLQVPLVNSVSCYCNPFSKLCIQPRITRKPQKTKNRSTGRNQPLLPGLPDDLAIACLVRVPRSHHTELHLVCERWQRLLSGNTFYSLRKNLGITEEWIYIIKRDIRDGKISWTAFDPLFNTWHPLPPIPKDFSRSHGFETAVLNGCHLYLLGGKVRLKGSTRQAILYNACTNRWHRVPDMLRKRSFFGCCVMNNYIYVAGGEREGGMQRALRSCEVYDPKNNCLSILADMSTPMAPYAGVVYDGKWFLKGLGPHREVQCLAYVPENGTWNPVRDGMVVGWRNPTVVINGKLYCSDCGDGCRLKVFDESSNSWKIFVDSEMHLGNSPILEAAALVPLNGKIYVVRNNMSISMIDVSSNDNERLECKPGTWEHIEGKGHTQNRFTSILSSLAKRGGSKSQIVHCQVLRA